MIARYLAVTAMLLAACPEYYEAPPAGHCQWRGQYVKDGTVLVSVSISRSQTEDLVVLDNYKATVRDGVYVTFERSSVFDSDEVELSCGGGLPPNSSLSLSVKSSSDEETYLIFQSRDGFFQGYYRFCSESAVDSSASEGEENTPPDGAVLPWYTQCEWEPYRDSHHDIQMTNYLRLNIPPGAGLSVGITAADLDPSNNPMRYSQQAYTVEGDSPFQ